MDASNMEDVHFKLHRSLVRALDDIADRDGMTRSELLRQVIRELVHERAADPKLAGPAAGVFGRSPVK